uniref:NADH-ubiquinone oxidoreductase chain 4 n=1 Tax=Leptynoptera sulfurea TaxID=1950150 RepID=A0A344A2H2_9HEMI|nr:NADH dehydrogenase subunit 4 [Leptynoptera sulfurea]AWU48963.1 NADH dehydrogenase subunit 4 [Leptynoptera sulfurea]
MLEIMFYIFFMSFFSSWVLFMNSLIFCFIYLVLNLYDYNMFFIQSVFSLLSLWLVLGMIMTVKSVMKKKDLYMIMLVLIFLLVLTFYSESLIMFYMGFEMSILPVLLIIYGWGYQPDRLEAGFYMILYTVLFSLPLLLLMFYVDTNLFYSHFMMFLMLMVAFLVKLPMFGFHFWLPRAHVEAPVFGSMVLAGVMLKLGGYGIVKLSFVFGDSLYKYTNFFIIFSMMGGLWLSCICFVQSDMKMLIAYSSIIHMSLVLSGMFTLKDFGLMGSIYMMVGHGLCSSGMFCIMGLTYDRTHTRSIYLNKGLLMISPTCSLWWFLFCSSNLSFPPCLNLPGEILLNFAIISWYKMCFMILVFLGLLSAMYSIYMFAFTQQSVTLNYFPFFSINIKEFFVLILHWLPLNFLILDLSFLF